MNVCGCEAVKFYLQKQAQIADLVMGEFIMAGASKFAFASSAWHPGIQ